MVQILVAAMKLFFVKDFLEEKNLFCFTRIEQFHRISGHDDHFGYLFFAHVLAHVLSAAEFNTDI